jgi:hypothetical protein
MTKAEFLERCNKLSDMKPGDVAVTIDRERLLVCAYANDAHSNDFIVIDLKNLQDQYLHESLSPKTRIRFLVEGDQYVITQ